MGEIMSNKNNIEQNYNRHIRKARRFAKGYHGYERAIKICSYFESVGHPHPNYTFNEVRMSHWEGNSERQFAIELMKEMAHLVAVNESLIEPKLKN